MIKFVFVTLFGLTISIAVNAQTGDYLLAHYDPDIAGLDNN